MHWRSSWLRWKLGTCLIDIAWSFVKRVEDMLSPDDTFEQYECLSDMVTGVTKHKAIATEWADGTITIHQGYKGTVEKE
jgi:hypothetical protein